MTKRIILIGGMPTAGKSTLAEKLSSRLDLPWISTDQIGAAMRSVASKDEHPALFTWDGYGGFRYLSELTAGKIADNEFAKGAAVWPGVRQLIRGDRTWNDGFIVEGDDILPHLVARDCSASGSVSAVFVGSLDRDGVRRVVLARNFAGAEASEYPADIKEREVDWVLDYGEKLKHQLGQYGMPWVTTERNERDVASVLEAVGGVEIPTGRLLS